MKSQNFQKYMRYYRFYPRGTKQLLKLRNIGMYIKKDLFYSAYTNIPTL